MTELGQEDMEAACETCEWAPLQVAELTGGRGTQVRALGEDSHLVYMVETLEMERPAGLKDQRLVFRL